MNWSKRHPEDLAVAPDIQVRCAIGHIDSPAMKLLAMSLDDVFNQREHRKCAPAGA